MKVPELYISEILTLNHCITACARLVSREFEKDKKKTERAMFFRPWAKGSIAVAFSIRAQANLEILKQLSGIQDKLLNSTGVDEDMQPVTLKKLLNIEDK